MLCQNRLVGRQVITPGAFGSISALCLGTADFMGRFSSRGMDHYNALLGMLIAGTTFMTVWIVWDAGLPSLQASSAGWIILNGIATMIMTLTLYLGLARGPISVVASIVAAHPVLVIMFYMIWNHSAPTPIQAVAMFVTIAGTIIVAWSASESPEKDEASLPTGSIAVTIGIAACSCVAYAVLIVAGQTAAEVYGQVHTLWMGRIVSLFFLLLLFGVRRRAPSIPVRWWPFVTAQGILDAGGYIALFTGSIGPGKETVTVVAATFGVVTILLARFILKETINRRQWFGIVLVFSGVMVLSTSHT